MQTASGENSQTEDLTEGNSEFANEALTYPADNPEYLRIT